MSSNSEFCYKVMQVFMVTGIISIESTLCLQSCSGDLFFPHLKSTVSKVDVIT